MEMFPRRIDPEAFNNEKVVFVAAGSSRSAAVTASGLLYIWGNHITHIPRLVDAAGFDGQRVVKVAISGEDSRSAIFATTSTGALWSLGNSNSKLLGLPSSSIISSLALEPVLVPAFKENRIVDVFGGLGQHVAAIAEINE
jgi:alpha-tubulin suppressor-like RCC1 family protein